MTAIPRYRAATLEQKLNEQGRRKDWLAAQVGVHPSTISHLLSRRRTADDKLAWAIAEALGEKDVFLLFELTTGNDSVTREQAA